MNYELAKELKENGFIPLRINKSHTFSDEELLEEIVETHLEELIEMCGEDFHQLTYWPTFREKWVAQRIKKVEVDGEIWTKLIPEIKANFPEEAVAGLWLALNKK